MTVAATTDEQLAEAHDRASKLGLQIKGRKKYRLVEGENVQECRDFDGLMSALSWREAIARGEPTYMMLPCGSAGTMFMNDKEQTSYHVEWAEDGDLKIGDGTYKKTSGSKADLETGETIDFHVLSDGSHKETRRWPKDEEETFEDENETDIPRLRELQAEVVADLNARAAVLDFEVEPPCDGGETYIIRRVGSGKKVKTFAAIFEVEKFLGKREAERKAEAATVPEIPPAAVMTLARRVKAMIDKADKAADKAEQLYKSAGLTIKEIKEKRPEDWETIVRDECGLEEIIPAYPDAIVIGLTATPCRSDGRGLGNHFETIVEGPDTAELIKLGRLVPPKIFAPDPPDLKGVETAKTGDYVISQLEARMNTDALVGDVVEHWLRHSERRRTVGFAVDVAHSVHITRELVKSGVRAEHLDGTTKQEERDAILARLASGETEFVSNCAVLTEGFDLPDLGCIVLVRPTKSLLLYRQMIGRGLRAAADKKDCILLDHAGAVHRHGLPTDHITWTLATDKRAANKAHERRKSEHKDPLCECVSCGHLRMRGFACDNCGWEPKKPGNGIDFIDENLVELSAHDPQRKELERQIFYRELLDYQSKARKKDGSPYSKGWAAFKFQEKYCAMPPWNWKDFPALPCSDATRRWIRSRFIAYAKGRAAA